MKSEKNTTGAESPALGAKAFYHSIYLTGEIVDYLPYKSTSHGIKLVAEKAIIAIKKITFQNEQNRQVYDRVLAMVH